MNQKILTLMFFSLLLASCSKGQLKQSENKSNNDPKGVLLNDKDTVRVLPGKLSYNYDCLDDGTGVSTTMDLLNFIKSETVSNLGVPVTTADVEAYGKRSFEEIKKSNNIKIIKTGDTLKLLQETLKKILPYLQKPVGYHYEVVLVDSSEFNAYTCGGIIVVYTGLIKNINTESELAFILAHEIGHNEKGHIKLMVQEMKTAEAIAGDLGKIAVQAQYFVAPSFNQKNEVEADLYAATVIFVAGYNVCKGISIWKDLSKKEKMNKFDNFFRSHPYSQVRFDCLVKHVGTNFNVKCL